MAIRAMYRGCIEKVFSGIAYDRVMHLTEAQCFGIADRRVTVLPMEDASTDRPKRGRPTKSEAVKRQDRFLDYCLEQFMQLGYRNTTMDGLASAFGASKSTIYRRYGSKAGLLRAVMARGVPLLVEPLTDVSTDLYRTPRDVLHDYARIIQRYARDPSIQAMWRAVSEARDELGDALEEVTTLRNEIVKPIASYLAMLQQEDLLIVGDPQAAAACFTELASGGLTHFLGRPLNNGECRKAVDFAVDLFLEGTLPRRPQ